MPYRDEPRAITSTHERVARSLALLAGCALAYPAMALFISLMPVAMRSSPTAGALITWLVRLAMLAPGVSGLLLARRLEGLGKRTAAAGGALIVVWSIVNVAVHHLLQFSDIKSLLFLNGAASLLLDVGVLVLAFAVAQVRPPGVLEAGIALRACAATLGGAVLQSLIWISGAQPTHGYPYWSESPTVTELLVRIDNVTWAIPFVLLAIGALQRRRPRSIALAAASNDDDEPASSRATAATEGLALFGVARALVAAGTIAAFAIGMPLVVLIAATILGGRPVDIEAASRTLLFPHGTLLAALGMALYETRRGEAAEAATGARAFLALATASVALSSLLFHAGGSLDFARSFETDVVYASWALAAAIGTVALGVVMVDVHRRARFAFFRTSDGTDISNFSHGTDDIVRTASIAGGVAALSSACGQCSTSSNTRTALWAIAAIVALAGVIAAATAAKRARRLADRLEAFQR